MADDEIQSRFSPNKPLEADVVGELRSIMRLHDLSVEDLYLKWDSYCLKMETDADAVTLSAVRSLKQTIQDTLEKDNTRRVQAKPSATPRSGAARGAAGGGDVFGMLDNLVPSTPASGAKLAKGGGSGLRRKAETPRSTLGSSPATGKSMGDQLKAMNGAGPATPFSDRTNAGEVVEVLNSHLDMPDAPMAPFSEPRIKLKAASDQTKMAYKPLSMKLSEASEILDDRIDEFISIVQEHHNLEDAAFGSAASQSTSSIVAVGRIASDSMEGKLNAASLVLETSRRTGMGLRVPLDMDKIKSWSFFPGQIVALKGTNASGSSFVVDEMLEIPPLPSAATSLEGMRPLLEKLRGGPDAMDSDAAPPPLNILFAAGPYSADDNLDFEPLHSLCTQAADTYADALVLNGPFIDMDHPLIASGDFDLPEDATYDPDMATMNTVFRYLFAPALNRLVSSNPHITVILVPSVRDAMDKHVSWPQDTITRLKELGLPKAVRLVTNPMTVQMNESVIALSSQDVLYEMRGEEVVKGASGDLMGRLCRYLIEQRHYFPLYPPMDRSRLPKTGTEDGIATGAVLDVSYLKLGSMVNVRPDVIVTPSLLPPFARVVESVLVINPGPLSKRRGAGTYARIALYPLSAGEGDAIQGLVGHKVFERARVEIVRI